jgi:hypothetical protein
MGRDGMRHFYSPMPIWFAVPVNHPRTGQELTGTAFYEIVIEIVYYFLILSRIKD